MKKISVLVPCYNEEENVEAISAAILEQLDKLSNYDYELVFIDNCSKDKTRNIIEGICSKNKNTLKSLYFL